MAAVFRAALKAASAAIERFQALKKGKSASWAWGAAVCWASRAAIHPTHLFTGRERVLCVL